MAIIAIRSGGRDFDGENRNGLEWDGVAFVLVLGWFFRSGHVPVRGEKEVRL